MIKKYSFFWVGLLFLMLPSILMADDTAIYGTTSVSVKPNVLIIFDNSSSMTSTDVTCSDYEWNRDYSQTVDDGFTAVGSSLVFKRVDQTGGTYTWESFLKDGNQISVSDITCAETKSDLSNEGLASTWLNTDLSCSSSVEGGVFYELRTGNFINYENSTFEAEHRYEVTKRALSRLLADPANTDKYFGLMVFNGRVGGTLVKECKTDNTTTHNAEIKSYIEAMEFNDFYAHTPLAETLADAGKYFAGERFFINTGESHESPIIEPCQKNYIILITDGEPYSDKDRKLYNGTIYMNDKSIGDYDNQDRIPDDGIELDDFQDENQTRIIEINNGNGSRFLDDVAKFLYDNDVSTMGDGTSFEKQNIITYTIGLKTDQPLLQNTAKNGGGRYFYAGSSSALSSAFESINNSINEQNAVFLAPSVPVNKNSRTDQGDWMYLALFKPQTTGEWFGNIKKYALGENGEIYGKQALSGTETANTSFNAVTDMGQIKENAISFWTTEEIDGNDTAKGGVGEKLSLIEDAASTDPMVNRNVYMLTGSTPDPEIKAEANVFKAGNPEAVSLAGSASTINAVRLFTTDWHLGAIIHSQPAVVHYSASQSVIYVGANDGMIHAFDETDGKELWAFIPPGQVSRLSQITDTWHSYYVDGSPSISYSTSFISGTDLFEPKDLIIGERRGGTSYYVIDISAMDNPTYKYAIEDSILSSETLGQSWCKPTVCTISGGTSDGDVDTTKEKDVFLIAGGYDTNQDADVPATPDTVGKAIISVNTSDGTLSSFFVSDATLSSMENCIVSLNTDTTYTDKLGRLITTRVYAGDLGGKVFVFADDIAYGSHEGTTFVTGNVPSGDFSTRFCLFNTSGKKIFYAPQNSRIGYSRSEWVVFGTGNRENPSEAPNDRDGIYAVRNNWLDTGLTEADLFDTTDNLIAEGSDTQKESAADQLVDQKGWYITFYDSGEKLISTPIIVQDYIYFTTYVPASSTSTTTTSDACAGGDLGTSYLWSIKLENGAPVNDTDNDEVYEKEERRKQVAIMAQPSLVGEDLISTPVAEEVPTTINFDYFFWRQQ